MPVNARVLLRQTLVLVGLLVAVTPCDAVDSLIGQEFAVSDTLRQGIDANPDSAACLEGLCWKPAEFTVSIEPPAGEHGELLVRFNSPVATGNEVNDRVALEASLVRNADGEPVSAPAVVVIHESGKSMPVGRLFAAGFRQRGVHAFMLQLPNYGVRRTQGDIPPENLLSALRQGVADARRARDAVAALPFVEKERIGLQGTSLGGFVASTAGALDDGYQFVFLTLSGGDLFGIVKEGKRDAAKVRERLERAGVDDVRLREMTQAIEPLRVAHRLNAESTFMYSGLYDDVVPMSHARVLANAIGLASDHHTMLPADHYTGIIFLPVILDHMATQIRGVPVAGPQPSSATSR